MKNKKKKNKSKTFYIGIILVILFGLFIIYSIFNTMNKKIEKFVIEMVESDVSNGENLKVNKIEYASKKIEIGELKLEVKNRKLYINDRIKYIDDDGVIAVTGYLYQPANTYHIYVLTGDEEIYSLTNVNASEVLEYKFIDTEIEDVDKLILVDITLENKVVGQLPERNRAYAIIDEDIVLIR